MVSSSADPRFDATPLLAKWMAALPDAVRAWAAARVWILTVKGRRTQGGFCFSLAAEATRAARIQAAAGVPLVAPDEPDLFLIYMTPLGDDVDDCRAFFHEIAHCYYQHHHEPGARHRALPWVYSLEREADRAADAWLLASGLYSDDGAPVAEPHDA
jgi:hypothetical protein